MDGTLHSRLAAALLELPVRFGRMPMRMAGEHRNGSACLRATDAVALCCAWIDAVSGWLDGRLARRLDQAAYSGYRFDVDLDSGVVYVDRVMLPTEKLGMPEEHARGIAVVRTGRDAFRVRYQLPQDVGAQGWAALGHPSLSDLADDQWNAEVAADHGEDLVFRSIDQAARAGLVTGLEQMCVTTSLRRTGRRVASGMWEMVYGSEDLVTRAWDRLVEVDRVLASKLEEPTSAGACLRHLLVISADEDLVTASIEVWAAPSIGDASVTLDVCEAMLLADGRFGLRLATDGAVDDFVAAVASGLVPGHRNAGRGIGAAVTPGLQFKRVTSRTGNQILSTLRSLPLCRARGQHAGDASEALDLILGQLAACSPQIARLLSHPVYTGKRRTWHWEATVTERRLVIRCLTVAPPSELLQVQEVGAMRVWRTGAHMYRVDDRLRADIARRLAALDAADQGSRE